METARISTASLSANGDAVLFTSDASGVPGAWTVPFAGEEPVQLTRSSDPLRTHGYFPADERFLYSADQDGDERTHIFVRNPDGSVRDLTPGVDLRAMFLGWSADGRGFFFASNERDPRRMDVYEMYVDGYERTLLYRNDGGVRVGAISPDRRLLAYVRLNSNRDNDLFLYDRKIGQETRLSSRDGGALSFPHGFGAGGRHLYYTTDRDSDFRYLVRYDVETGEHQTVLRPEWDVMNVALSPAGRYVAAAVNVDARTELHLLETATLEPVPLPSMPTGDITAVAFSRDERRLALPVGSGRSPGDLYVLDLDEGEPRLLVRTLSPEIEPEHLVEPEVVRFASYDGLEIPGLLYRPHGASPDAPVPVLIWIHGGPGGQFRVGYDPLIQYLVNHQYAVYAINNRGSTGYGRSFEALDDRKHGEVDLDDVVASRQMLIDTGWVDPDRIGVMGSSYGGYLTMAALTFRPETFAAGVNIYGVTNWIRTLEARDGARPWMQSGQKSILAELGDPTTDRERLHRISPLFHADRITKPFLVLQGANDQRVLQIESDEIVAAARANGVPVEYIVFPDEGHGILKKENQRRAYEAVLDFLEQHLKGPASERAYTGPIIDMHLHSYTADDYWGGSPSPATGRPAPASATEHMERSIEVMRRYNVVLGVPSGDALASAQAWWEYAPDRVLRGVMLEDPDAFVTPKAFRGLVERGEVEVLGEVGAQYAGRSPSDPAYSPYWAVAEEHGIPVAIHTGASFPGMPYQGRPAFRLRYGNPLLLEDMLVEFPELKVYMMHAGGAGPYSEYGLMMMNMYPQLRVDVGVLSWMPGMEGVLAGFLRQAKAMRMLDRVMFGSDQMVWPEAIGLAVERIDRLEFLSAEEKAAIFYGNAARFLGLSEEVMARHHEVASRSHAEGSR